jgi:hypothetical protein
LVRGSREARGADADLCDTALQQARPLEAAGAFVEELLILKSVVLTFIVEYLKTGQITEF